MSECGSCSKVAGQRLVGAVAWLLLSLHVCLAAFGGASSALDGLMVLQALLEAIVPPRALWLIWCQRCGKLALGGASGDRRRPMYMRP